MTSIKLMLTGAHAWAVTNGPLTSGMVGVPVTIEYDEAWDGLTKNLMCRCSPWNSSDGEIRTVLNVEDTSTVAHEVMQPNMYLHLGVEGFSSDGTLVIPTTWAMCGKIEYGANTCEDPTTEPELPIWNQLQTEVEQIKRDGYTQEQIDEIQAYVQSASQAASSASKSENNAAAASNLAVNHANLAEIYVKQAQASAENASTSAGSAANLANGALQAQRAAEAAAERAEAAANSGGNASPSTAQINALDGMFRVCAFVQEDVSAQYNAFRVAFGLDSGGDTTDKTLTGISAVYSGGDVPVGTAVTALTGIVVTAHYSDGTSAAVTGYTLSGVIAEGDNIITVTYQGQTTTITVAGTAEAGEPETDDHDSGLIDLTTQTIGDFDGATHQVLNKHTLIVTRTSSSGYCYILVNGLTPGAAYDLYIEQYDAPGSVSVYANKTADATDDSGYGRAIQTNTGIVDVYDPLQFTLAENEYGIIIYCYASVTKLKLVAAEG